MQPHDTLRQIEGYRTAKHGLRYTDIARFLAKNSNEKILTMAQEASKKISELLSNGFKDWDGSFEELQKDFIEIQSCISIMSVYTRDNELFVKAAKKLFIIDMALGYFIIPTSCK